MRNFSETRISHEAATFKEIVLASRGIRCRFAQTVLFFLWTSCPCT